MQLTIRAPLRHGEDVEAVADYLPARETQGDGVVYVPEELRVVALLHPQQTARLADPALDLSAEESGIITGRDVRSPNTLIRRMARCPRLWVVRSGTSSNSRGSEPAKLAILRQLIAQRSAATVGRFDVDLYVRLD